MLIIEKLKIEGTFSEAEEGIARFLLKTGREIAGYSTRNLAEATYTSPATVIRLCKKIGFKGFDDFKDQFLKEIQYLEKQPGSVDANFPFDKNDTIMMAANKISRLYEETIQDTMSLMQHKMLKKAVTLMKYSQCIHIFSAGAALNQAESFRERMLKIGKHVSITNNLRYQLYEASCMTGKDVAVIISYSGETSMILQIASECKRRSVPVIAITSFGENSLSHYAACKLTLSTKESMFQNLGDYSSHISVNLILDILYSSYFLQDYEGNYQKKLEKVTELENLRTSSNSIIMNSRDPGGETCEK